MLLQNDMPSQPHPTRDRCDLVRSVERSLSGIGTVHIMNSMPGGIENEEAGVAGSDAVTVTQ